MTEKEFDNYTYEKCKEHIIAEMGEDYWNELEQEDIGECLKYFKMGYDKGIEDMHKYASGTNDGS